MDIGGRIRYLRVQHGLSQRALAKRVGIMNSTISLIESNQMNPSIGALKRILDGFPIGLAEFFVDDLGSTDTIFFAADELREIGKGPISLRQVGHPLFGRALQILRERYEPGANTGRIPLVHEGEQAGIVISGRLEVTVGEMCKILGPGDAYHFDGRQPHRFRCIGHSPSEVVSARTPPSF